MDKIGITDKGIQDTVKNNSLCGNYNYIRIDPSNNEAKGVDGNENEIKNKGAFFENLHYDLTIKPTPEDLMKQTYEVVLIPGGGDIALYDKNGKLNIAKACNMESGAIIIPATISHEKNKEGYYHLTFDYNVSGGSSLPVYAVIVKK